MKNFYYLILSFCILSCNSEEGLDCFKKQGEQITQEISVEFFEKISISDGIELTIKQDTIQAIYLTAGKNLINDIHFKVENGELKISDENGCEILRNTSRAKVYLTTPILQKINSCSQFSIHSDGVLKFPQLELSSGIEEETPASIFDLEIENDRLLVNDNVSSVFRITGKTHHLTINFWGSNGRFEGENLKADEVEIFQRSTNDMIVFPIDKIQGKILSTGNVVLKNLPPVVEVEQLFTGHLIYP